MCSWWKCRGYSISRRSYPKVVSTFFNRSALCSARGNDINVIPGVEPDGDPDAWLGSRSLLSYKRTHNGYSLFPCRRVLNESVTGCFRRGCCDWRLPGINIIGEIRRSVYNTEFHRVMEHGLNRWASLPMLLQTDIPPLGDFGLSADRTLSMDVTIKHYWLIDGFSNPKASHIWELWSLI